jgi:hypothetical protein
MRVQGVEVGDMLLPSDRCLARNGRLASAALVIVEERAAGSEQVVLREQIIVTGTRAAVQHHDHRPRADLAREEANAVYFNEHERRD